jgi:hypothetical protein
MITMSLFCELVDDFDASTQKIASFAFGDAGSVHDVQELDMLVEEVEDVVVQVVTPAEV